MAILNVRALPLCKTSKVLSVPGAIVCLGYFRSDHVLQDMDYEAVLILATLRESQAERLQQNPPPTVIRGPGSGPLLGQSPVIAGGRTPQIPGDTPAARSSAQGMIPGWAMVFVA